MLVSLSDLVTCPLCGPTHGLILLPDEVRDRRVIAGVLGCPNCRERFPVKGGTVDLREPGRREGSVAPGAHDGTAAGGGTGVRPDRESAVRLAALMELAEATGTVLVAGPAAVHASEVAALVAGVEVVAVDPPEPAEGAAAAPAGGAAAAPVTRLRVGGVIPFRSGSLRGVALTGPRTALLEEAARALGPGGRLVLDPAPEGVRERLAALGLGVLAEGEGTVVAGR